MSTIEGLLRDIHYKVGQLEASNDAINDKLDAQGETLTRLDDRVRSVEHKSAINGAFFGGLVALGLGFIKTKTGIDV